MAEAIQPSEFDTKPEKKLGAPEIIRDQALVKLEIGKNAGVFKQEQYEFYRGRLNLRPVPEHDSFEIKSFPLLESLRLYGIHVEIADRMLEKCYGK